MEARPTCVATKRLAMTIRVLLIIGMHRSGTSYVASACGAVGLDLPPNLMPGNAANPRGYFEPLEVVRAHTAVLSALGRPWWDIAPMPAGWAESEAAQTLEVGLERFLDHATAGDTPLVVKDPRASLLLPAWDRVIRTRGGRLSVILMLRDPGQVAASLDARDDINPLVGAAMWWRYVAEAHNAVAALGVDNVVLEYPGCMHEPERVHAALSRLGLAPGAMDKSARDRLAAVTELGLHRQKGSPPEAAHHAIFEAGRGLMDRLVASEPIAPDAAPVSDHPALTSAGAWWPQWRRLYARHEALLGATRNAHRALASFAPVAASGTRGA